MDLGVKKSPDPGSGSDTIIVDAKAWDFEIKRLKEMEMTLNNPRIDTVAYGNKISYGTVQHRRRYQTYVTDLIQYPALWYQPTKFEFLNRTIYQ